VLYRPKEFKIWKRGKMQNGYYQAAGAMVTQFNRLDVTTNNLANVNTSGYKKDDVVIGDFERLYREARERMPLANQTKKAAKFINRTLDRVPHIVERTIDFTPANVRHTGNPLDLALQGGDLFFAVDTPNGVRLTQQSSFTLDHEGTIVTKEGYRLLPADFMRSNERKITLPENATILIDPEGNIKNGDQPVGQIFIGRVDNLKALKKEGDNLLTMENLAENLTQMEKGNFVKQEYMTLSNVNAVKEMTSLIEINRLVEIYQKIMTSHMDDLNRDAITKLATPRA